MSSVIPDCCLGCTDHPNSNVELTNLKWILLMMSNIGAMISKKVAQ